MIAVRVARTPLSLEHGSLDDHELETQDMGEVQQAIWCRMACGFQAELAFKHKNHIATYVYIRRQA